MGNQILTNIASLPPQAFNSGRNFMAAGGATAILGPMLGNNPLAMIGLKMLQGRFMEEPRINIQQAVPVSIVSVKNTAMDAFTLSQGRSAYTDTWSRRAVVARTMR